MFAMRFFGKVRRAASLLAATALLSNSLFVIASPAAQKGSAPKASEEQRIVHVLNRLGFGPRPGDVERVRAVGLARYVEQQLDPAGIDDSAAEARLKDLTTLRMTTSELLAKFPNPGQLVRQLQRRGELPADLAEVAEVFRPNNPQAQGMTPNPNARPQGDNPAAAGANGEENRRAEYRRAIVRYMRENGMEPPQRITAELNASRILRAAYSERQLQEVMVDFWSNHFNVFVGKGADRWFLTSYDRDVIRPNALGKFRDLLEATAKSPAMLFYLDNFQSVSPQAGAGNRRRALDGLFGGNRRNRRMNDDRMERRRDRQTPRGGDEEAAMTRAPQQQQQPAPQRPRRGINENYARELMELHTLGVDGGYTQKDVQEVARAFTGWTIIAPRGAAGAFEGLRERAGTFQFVARLHDAGEKTVLGQKIPSGGGQEDGRRVLDILTRHPSTARFIATKLARRFVTDDPPPALVARVAAAFTRSDGDIRDTLRALFSSPEFNSAEARRAKIKTPFELAVSSLRALGAETNGGAALHQWIARMGEGLYQYQAPTGYPDTAEHWVNTGGLLERLNFALALVSNRVPGTRVDLARLAGDEAAAPGRAVDQQKMVARFVDLILRGEMSDKSRAVLMKQLTEQAGAPLASEPAADEAAPSDSMAGPPARGARRAQRLAQADLAANAAGNPEVARIAALVLGSPEFQRQ
jgi:uncharacterized protein (DUF1800 family)